MIELFAAANMKASLACSGPTSHVPTRKDFLINDDGRESFGLMASSTSYLFLALLEPTALLTRKPYFIENFLVK